MFIDTTKKKIKGIKGSSKQCWLKHTQGGPKDAECISEKKILGISKIYCGFISS